MTPLAERMRPQSLAEFVGQEHLVGEGAVLRQAIERGKIPSFILWGPPGVGKTTLAQLIAKLLNKPFYQLSAINAGVKDIREAIESADPHALTLGRDLPRILEVTAIGHDLISPVRSRRRVEITGPVERKMMINALNSGAKSFMADFDDSFFTCFIISLNSSLPVNAFQSNFLPILFKSMLATT